MAKRRDERSNSAISKMTTETVDQSSSTLPQPRPSSENAQLLKILKRQQSLTEQTLRRPRRDTNVQGRVRLPFDLPKYSGTTHEDLLTWLDATHMACADEDIPAEGIVSVIKHFFADDAHFWFYVKSGLLEQNNTTFAKFAADLKDRFLPEHKGTDLWRKLNRLQQGRMNMKDFNEQFRKLTKQVRDTLSIDELLAHTYLEQLNPKLWMWVRTEWKKGTTQRELMHQAEQQSNRVRTDASVEKRGGDQAH